MKFCPHCGEDLSAYLAVDKTPVSARSTKPAVSVQKDYDQTKIWKEIMESVRLAAARPPGVTELGLRVAEDLRPVLRGGPVSTIVHLAFDKDIVPQGGALYHAALLDGRDPGSVDKFTAMGYDLDDGKVRLVDDVPVGPIYGLLEYWGGEKQHRRWHLSEPVRLNPSRHGDPFFMDENMVAFGAKFKDAERLDEGILELLTLLEQGPDGRGGVGAPVEMKIVALPS